MDATSCLTRREGTATVFVVVDHCASECIGIHAAKPGTRFKAIEPLRQGVLALFGGYERGIALGLLARHDHDSQYVSDYFQDERKFLGITSSPAFVREPDGNGTASARSWCRISVQGMLPPREQPVQGVTHVRTVVSALTAQLNRDLVPRRHARRAFYRRPNMRLE